MLFSYHKTASENHITVGDDTLHPINVFIQPHKKTKKLILRFNSLKNRAEISIPYGVSIKSAETFANKHYHWLVQQKNNNIPVTIHSIIPVRGVAHQLSHDTVSQRGESVSLRIINVDNKPFYSLIVRGDKRHFQRRLCTYLKQQARLDVNTAVAHFCALQNSPVPKITIRDQRTCWGSCSKRSGLSFSWRLIMAPRFVLEYVAAHEVAHIKVPNHSSDFWQQTEILFPHYKEAKKWLQLNGQTLHQYYFSYVDV